ncbi:hypothetical protein J3Q64DRAFT_1818421 [Phycomyces blakesleeanus]|uniref:Uncharacterized protein n=2 Tax=Phycomyces blakesleeanus TaxID=4837 RepID=A0A167QT13_PHYB8|nr:hypothetical protein PHYBLDRAFT_59249 [Phycomyces blakesleeanus NRRL 1555(-)]OAD80221.1 hypothetical protein PHYBLDRAFT_59249 [Phycomyces blakesleeanus NRRL 1555(-)]|eukprot:XP_018298261.1 hypothetical protein PHYBLDRAFT_59249 [Phycomyces blakesleeanus NRRL 1555(-)]
MLARLRLVWIIRGYAEFRELEKIVRTPALNSTTRTAFAYKDSATAPVLELAIVKTSILKVAILFVSKRHPIWLGFVSTANVDASLRPSISFISPKNKSFPDPSHTFAFIFALHCTINGRN